MKLRHATTASVSIALFILAVACSGAKPGSGFGDTGGGGGESGGGGDNGGGGGTPFGGGGGSGGAGGTFGGDDGGDNVGDASCASSKSVAQQNPLDMYIMLDQSGSMNDTVAGGGTKWTAVTGALTSFVQSTVTGISVGLQYFALPASGGTNCPTSCQTDTDCGTNGPCIANLCFGCIGGGGTDSCTAADYAKPEVEIAALPGVATQIQQSISQHSPSTSTPTSAALQGAIQHASSWATAHTGDVVVAVLATDGDPTECDTNISDIDTIAAAGVSGTPKILTFVIGVGASTGNLNSIASAGGTTTAFFVDTTKNVNQQFLQALNTIRGTALGCTYKIPLPTTGTPDFSAVNVEYTPNGGSPQLIPQVANKAACPSTGDAWYYDNPSAPTQIILCAATCSTIQASANGEVDVLTGCKTVVR